jgi:hypothetical protein
MGAATVRGQLIRVWSESWREIWETLASEESAPNDLYCELFRELAIALKKQLNAQELADIIDDPLRSKETFQQTRAEELMGERALAEFFEKTHGVLGDLAGDALANPYFNLLSAFIEKFSLRYDLRRPCILCPTLTGVFASLMHELKRTSSGDAHLDGLMKEFENAVRDLRDGCSNHRIKSCIQKQVNLLEAIGRNYPGVTAKTFGTICDQVGTWPHDKVKEAIKNLYTFTCDYPGIRHAGTPSNSRRDIDMRDMIAVTIFLLGISPYLTDQVDASVVYRGA